MNATLLLSLLRCWLAGNLAEGRKGAPGLVRVDGHIMKLNHFTDYKQLKLLCRHRRMGTRERWDETLVEWMQMWTTIIIIVVMTTIDAAGQYKHNVESQRTLI